MTGVTTATQERRFTSLHAFTAALGLAILAPVFVDGTALGPGLTTAATVFVAVCVQALPFLVLGVVLSGALAAFVPPGVLQRLLPARPAAAVPAAGAAGLVLPGCECASVPVARRLMSHGVPDAAALTFLLAAPAVNPVVLVATAVAFPGEPRMVAARFLASLATACVVGWLWLRFGRAGWIVAHARRPAPVPTGGGRWAVFAETARHDLVTAGGFLVLGAFVASAMAVLLPTAWLDTLAGNMVLAIAVMALLAVVLALCSEADAFVAASLSALPLLPRLVFLVVGPAVDVKLAALQAGTFGRGFAARFAPLTFVVAVVCAVVVGLVVLGGPR
jgi:uncharacterized membrane protein YraQ (UPF0718 family)